MAETSEALALPSPLLGVAEGAVPQVNNLKALLG